jgi:hypothetical protein
MVLQGGAVFTAGYVVLVLVNVLRRPSGPVQLVKRVSRLSELAALGLALCSLSLAFAAPGPVPGKFVSDPLAPGELGTTLLVFLGGALLALGLARRATAGIGAAFGVGVAFEQADAFLRRWPSASIALLTLAALFGWLMLAGAPA